MTKDEDVTFITIKSGEGGFAIQPSKVQSQSVYEAQRSRLVQGGMPSYRNDPGSTVSNGLKNQR